MGGEKRRRSDCFVLLSCVLTYVLVCVIHIAQAVVVVVACIINRLQPGSPTNCARLYATEVCAKCPLLQAKGECVCVSVSEVVCVCG